MRVKDMIAILSKFDPELPVCNIDLQDVTAKREDTDEYSCIVIN
jgi:hypothetical protein